MSTGLRCCTTDPSDGTGGTRGFRIGRMMRVLLLLFGTLFGAGSLQASHFAGGEITYQFVSGNTYQVSLRFYRDCSGITFGSSQLLQVTPTNSGSSFTLPLVSTIDITPLCPGQTSRCSGGTVAGIQEVIFRGNVTLNPLVGNGSYTLFNQSCCRNAGITSLASSSSQSWYLSTVLNPNLSPRNNSPVFLNRPVAYLCAGQPATISPNASDPDGDAIEYALVPCMQTVSGTVNYAPGFSATTPLSTTGGVTLNTFTGLLSFTPSAAQVGVICVQANEFRNGVQIGSIVRDIQVVVRSCNNACPVVAPVTNQVVNVGQAFCVNLSASDADLDNLVLTATHSVGTFTATSSSAGSATGTFCFTPGIIHAGNTYTITISATDNSCPSTCTGAMTFNITVPVPCTGVVTATSTPATCGATNGSATATAVNFTPPVAYSWSNGASTATVNGLAAGTYSVTVVGAGGCVDDATVVVGSQGSSITTTTNVVSPTCPNTNNGSITVTASGGTAPYTYTLNGGASQSSNVFSGLSVGTYTIVATDALGCISSGRTVTLTAVDNVAPTASCPANITVNAAAGQCSAVVSYSVTGTDNCPGSVTVSQTAGQASGSTFGLGTTSNSFTVTDGFGNTANCSFTVTVVDAQAPAISCPANITVNNAAGVCGANVTYAVQASDNCPGVTTAQTAGNASGAFFAVGTTTNSFTAVDGSGNTSNCSFTVTVVDNEAPSISCPANISVNNDPGVCGAAVSYAVNFGDNCPGSSVGLKAGLASGSVFPVGTTTVEYMATDAAGNSSSCSFTVTVADVEAPVVTCQPNISVNNDPGVCGAAVTFTGSFTDNCPGVTVAQTAGLPHGSVFPIGTTANTFVFTDASGNATTCNFTVTVTDNQNPTISCPANISVSNDAGVCGAAVTYAVQSGDNCPGSTLVRTAGLASGSAFSIGTTTNSFTVTDASGNTASCSFTVTVSDNQNPTISCPANISVSNNSGVCGAAVAYAVQSGDNCPGSALVQTAGQASGSTFSIGTTTNSFTVTDAAGNTASCSFTVTVTDNQNPTISCPANISVNNNPGVCGAAVTYAVQSGDNCPGSTLAQNGGLASGSTFPIGTTTNSFTVTDASGNTATCSFTVTVTDNEAPNAVCQNVTVQLDANGNGSITAQQVNNGSSDNCGIASVTVDQTQFDCGDVAGGSATASELFFSEYIEGSGNNKCIEIFNGTGAAVDLAAGGYAIRVYFNGSTSFTNFPLTGTVANGGVFVFCAASANSTMLGQADQTTTAGLWNGDDAIVLAKGSQMLDIFGRIGQDPGAAWTATGLSTADRTLVRNANVTGGVTTNPSTGFATLAAEWTGLAIDNASNLGSHTFSPAVGGPVVTLTVTDVNGNVSTCNATVTVLDNVAPAAVCQNLTVQLDANGAASITANQVNNGSSDACGIASLALNNTSFNCSNVGNNTVTLTVTDVNGNVSTCTSAITVQDIVAPVAVCQDLTVQLDANGNASITANGVDNGSSDACGIASLVLNNTSFTCSNVGNNTVTLTVTDVNGNASTCTANITVEDNVAPSALCKNTVVQLDANGNGGIVAADVDNGSFDNCGIATLSVTPDAFNCSNVGGPVQASGLFISEYVEGFPGFVKYIEVYNGTGAAVNLANYELRLYANGASTPTNASSLAAGGMLADGASIVLANNNATLYTGPSIPVVAVNHNGDDAFALVNTSTGQVEDIFGVIGNDPGTAWTATGGYTTVDRTLRRKSTVSGGITTNPSGTGVSGFATLATEWDLAGANDVSGLGTHNYNPVGSANMVTLTVTDVNGNSSSCTAQVTVEDNVAPNAVCQNVTVQLDVNGNGSITAQDIDGGSNDACGIASISASQTAFNCGNVGANVVVLTVTDVNGNVSTCNANVTVEDNVAPVALCQDVTVQLDVNGNGSTTANAVDNGSNDACGIASLVLSQTAFNCSNVGNNGVVLTVTDVNGNVSTCNANVTVEDNVAPDAICQSVTVQLDANGNGSITAQDIDGGSSDACGIASIAASQTAFNCSHVGANNVTLTVTDVNGNVSTCVAVVTVEDNVAPVITCPLDVVVECRRDLPAPNTSLVSATDACGIASIDHVRDLDNGATGCAGDAYVIVRTYSATDVNGNVSYCQQTLTAEATPIVTTTSPNAVVFPAYQDSSCANISVSATGGCPGYTYMWSNGANTASQTVCPTVTTVYTVTVTDAEGCYSVDSVKVCVIDVICTEQSNNGVGGNGNSGNGVNNSGNAMQHIVFCHIPPGNPANAMTKCLPIPAVQAHMQQGHGGDYLGACGSLVSRTCDFGTGQSVRMADQAGAAESMTEAASVEAFPNPFSDATTLRVRFVRTEAAIMTVFDLKGTAVATLFDGQVEKGQTVEAEFNGAGLSDGLYFVRVVTESGEVLNKKVTLQR